MQKFPVLINSREYSRKVSTFENSREFCKPTSESMQFSELLCSLFLFQHVNQSTLENDYILNLIISLSSYSIILSDPASPIISPSLVVSRFPNFLFPLRKLPIVPNPSTSKSFLQISLHLVFSVLIHMIILRNL